MNTENDELKIENNAGPEPQDGGSTETGGIDEDIDAEAIGIEGDSGGADESDGKSADESEGGGADKSDSESMDDADDDSADETTNEIETQAGEGNTPPEGEAGAAKVKKAKGILVPAYNGLLPASLLAGLIGAILGIIPATLLAYYTGTVIYLFFIAAPLLAVLFNWIIKGGRDIRALIVTAVFSIISAYLTAVFCQAALYTSVHNISLPQIPILATFALGKSGVIPAEFSAYAYPLVFTIFGIALAWELLIGGRQKVVVEGVADEDETPDAGATEPPAAGDDPDASDPDAEPTAGATEPPAASDDTDASNPDAEHDAGAAEPPATGDDTDASDPDAEPTADDTEPPAAAADPDTPDPDAEPAADDTEPQDAEQDSGDRQ